MGNTEKSSRVLLFLLLACTVSEVVVILSRKCRTPTVLVLLLVVIGVITVGNSSRVWTFTKLNDASYFMSGQAAFALIGVFVMYMVSCVSLTKLCRYGKKLFILCVIVLILMLTPELDIQRNNSRSWFGTGSFLIQPSELSKIAITICVADFLAKRYRIKAFKCDLLFLAFLVIPDFDLALLQPDFRSGMVMVYSAVVIVLAADSPLSYFVRVGMLGATGLSGLIVSAPYRPVRITPFIDPWGDPLEVDFQIIQSLFVVSPGGTLGVGFDNSMQEYFYLPEPQTDFISTIFAKELGLIGYCILTTLLLMVIYQGVKIAKNSSNPYLYYAAIGLISPLATQMIVNLSVVVGPFPVTGITLPFISYGGSSSVVMMGSMGLLMSIANGN